MNNTQLLTDQCDQEPSIEERSDVSGGGHIAMAGWIALNLLSAGRPAFVDIAQGSPDTKEVIPSKV